LAESKTVHSPRIELNVHQISVGDDVVFSFHLEKARFPDGLLGTVVYEGFVRDHLGSDESPLQVRMNLSGRSPCSRASADGPGSDFVGPHGKERDEVNAAPLGVGSLAGIRAYDDFHEGKI
jgi:hypothetical protein